ATATRARGGRDPVRGAQAVPGHGREPRAEHGAGPRHEARRLSRPLDHLDRGRQRRKPCSGACPRDDETPRSGHGGARALMITPLMAHLLDAASRAPSAHNTQPWLLRPLAEELEMRVRKERCLPAGDPTGNDALHSIGAMLENLVLTLEQQGYAAECETAGRFEPGAAVVTLRWRRTDSPKPDAALYRMIPIRRTSRLPYRDEPVAGEALAAMR